MKLFIEIMTQFFFIYMVGYTLITIISTFYSIIKLNDETIYQRVTSDTKFKPKSPPVSILVPAYNEEPTILRTMKSLLSLDYEEYEIIVVNDGSSDKTMDKLLETYEVHPVEQFIRQYIPCNPIKQIYEGKYNGVTLKFVDKENGGKADALNAGINLAQYDLFLSMDADSMLQHDSLYNIAAPYVRYDNVVAVGGSVKIANQLTMDDQGHVTKFKLSKNPWIIFQTLEYFRAFLTTRIWFNRFNGNLIISGAFGLFKREAVIAVGGYTVGSIGEDMDLIVKLHSYFLKNKKPYRIEYNAQAICWTQGPSNLRDLKTQRIRWHKGLIQSLMGHRYIFFNIKYGVVSIISYMYFFIYEMLNPIFILLASFFSVFLVWQEMADFKFIIFFLSVYLVYLIVNSWASLYLERYFFKYNFSFLERMKLILFCILENIGFRQLNIYFKAIALLTIKKNTSWGTIKRYSEDEET